MQAVKKEQTQGKKQTQKTEYDKMLENIKLIVTRHRHETIKKEHFLNRGFVIK